MITLQAFDQHDGWLFAKDGDRLVLLRPPYRLNDLHVVSEATVARAVIRDGYRACERALPTWAEVIAFVRDEVARQRQAEGLQAPDESVGRTFLRSAPSSTVERFLERIKGELVPQGEYDDAEKLLRAMQIESPRLLESAELSRRTAQLLADVLRRRDERMEQYLRVDGQFPRLAANDRLPAVRKISQQIKTAGSMFHW